MSQNIEKVSSNIKHDIKLIRNHQPKMYSDVMEERFQKFMRENKGTFEFYDSDSSSSESESEDDEEEWIKISKAMIDSDSENMPNIKIETKSSRTRKRSYVKIICSICGKTMLKASYRKHVRVVHVGTKIEDALASSTLLKSTDVVPVQYSFLDLKKLKANVATKLQKVNTKTSAYKNLKTLLKHKTIHKSSSKMACSICFRILYDQKGLEKHQKFHADDSVKYQCHFCTFVYTKSCFLDYHMKSKHLIPPIA